METVGDLIDTSQRYRDTAKDLGEVITRFEEITESEENAALKNRKLTELQETLISLCGSEADGIDLVTDAFENQAGTVEKLNGLLSEYNEMSLKEAETALDRLNEAEQYKTALSLNSTVSGGYNTVLWAAQNLKTFDASGTVGGQAATKWNTYGALFKDNMMYLSGSYEDRLADLIMLKDYLLHEGGLNSNDEAVRDVTAMIEQLKTDSESKERYTQMIANLQNGQDADYEYLLGSPAIAAEEERKGKAAAAKYEKWKAEQETKAAEAKKSAEELSEEYKTQKQLADDMYGVGEISAEEYYNRLTVLRDSYLEQGSHEWYVATKEIKSLAEKLGDDLGKTAKTTADKIKDAFSDVKSEYQKTLDAIDAEIERHNREKQDKEYQGKVDALNARLKYEQLDIFSRRELEQELADIYEEWDETKYQRKNVDAKDMLDTVYTQTQDMINAAPDGDIADLLNSTFSAAFKDIGESFAKSIEQGTVTTQAVYNITINGMDKMPEQIVREVQRAISSDLI